MKYNGDCPCTFNRLGLMEPSKFRVPFDDPSASTKSAMLVALSISLTDMRVAFELLEYETRKITSSVSKGIKQTKKRICFKILIYMYIFGEIYYSRNYWKVFKNFRTTCRLLIASMHVRFLAIRNENSICFRCFHFSFKKKIFIYPERKNLIESHFYWYGGV